MISARSKKTGARAKKRLGTWQFWRAASWLANRTLERPAAPFFLPPPPSFSHPARRSRRCALLPTPSLPPLTPPPATCGRVAGAAPATAASASALSACSTQRSARLGLGTFETAHEAAHAYDAVASRLSRPPSRMNFDDTRTCQRAQDLAPPPRLVTDVDRQEHHRRQRRLLIAEANEQAMAEWRQHDPQDVADENAFWAKRRAKRRAEWADRHRWKALAISQCDLGQASFFDDNDPRWEDAFLSTSDDNTEEDDDSK
nr:uncharacterized protein LOC109778586 [Aegilops tauschii subsp. strangulata]